MSEEGAQAYGGQWWSISGHGDPSALDREFILDVGIGVTDRLASAWEDLVAVEGLGHDMGSC